MHRAERWLSEALDYRFRTPALFELALTHRSSSSRSYERLEFLGDAVLDLVVGHLLMDAYPDLREGQLSVTRKAAHLRVRVRISSMITNLVASYLQSGLGN